MNLVLEKGHSRVPVYYEQPTNIIGLVLVLVSSFSFRLQVINEFGCVLTVGQRIG